MIYNDYEIAFVGAGSWSFAKGFARNVVIFAAGNSLPWHAENRKNKFLALDQGLTDDNNDSVGESERKFSINFAKSNPNFGPVYITIETKVICSWMRQRFVSLKVFIL